MPIRTFIQLTDLHTDRIHALTDRCRRDAPLTLTFPFEASDLYLLYYDEKDALLSAAAFTQSANCQYECSAFTDPGYRNRGLFRELLDTALELLPEESDILFFSDGSCPHTEKTLEALGAEFLGREFFMELSPECFPKAATDHFPKTGFLSGLPGSAPAISREGSVNETPALFYQSDYGQASILLHESSCYLFDLEIREGFRGLGHGKALLSSILADLADRFSLPVLLQVSEDNLPALALYKKTGFQIAETLSCYLY